MSGKHPIDSLRTCNIIQNTESITIWNLEPEPWKSSLVQEKYWKERASDKRQKQQQKHNKNKNNNNPFYQLHAGYLQLYTWNKQTVFLECIVLQLFCIYKGMLFRPWNIFCTFTLVLRSMSAVPQYVFFFFVVPQLRIFLVRCSGIVWVILKYSVAPIIIGITFAFTFHMRWISVIRYLCFRILAASF